MLSRDPNPDIPAVAFLKELCLHTSETLLSINPLTPAHLCLSLYGTSSKKTALRLKTQVCYFSVL